MLREIEHLQKLTAVWFDTSDRFNRTTMVSLHDGVLKISQRENPNDVWPPSTKLVLDGIKLVRDK